MLVIGAVKGEAGAAEELTEETEMLAAHTMDRAEDEYVSTTLTM